MGKEMDSCLKSECNRLGQSLNSGYLNEVISIFSNSSILIFDKNLWVGKACKEKTKTVLKTQVVSVAK